MAPAKSTKLAQQQKASQQKTQQKAPQQKRQAQESQQLPPSKKSKENSLLTAVTDGLQGADDLPEACRSMITALAQNCLVVPAKERHEIQNWAVKIIGEALYGEKQRLETSLQAEVEKLSTTEESRANLASNVCMAEKELADVLVTRQTRETEHKAAAEVASAATAKLAEAEEAHRACIKDLEAIQETRVALQEAMSHNFAALQNDVGCEASEKMMHVDAVLAVARKGALDATLVTVLPGALSKNMADRGDFDKMAVAQLEESMAKREQELVASIASAEGKVVDATSAIEAVQHEIRDKIENERLASSALAEGQSALEQAQQSMQEANAAAADFEPRYNEAIKSRDQRRASLEQFEALNLSCYETLREQPKPATAEDRVETTTESVEPPAVESSVPTEDPHSQATSPETQLELAAKLPVDESSVSHEAQAALGGQ